MSSASPSTAVGRRLSPILLERRDDQRRTLEDQALGGADHAIHNGAFEQLAAGPDHHPAKSGEPAARVQRLQGSAPHQRRLAPASTRASRPSHPAAFPYRFGRGRRSSTAVRRAALALAPAAPIPAPARSRLLSRSSQRSPPACPSCRNRRAPVPEHQRARLCNPGCAQ